MEVSEVDTLICGGGMSGMACAAFTAEAGAKTRVFEKQEEVGGSSNLSAGMFWAPNTYEKLRSWVPHGDPDLQRAWLDEYLPAVQWMRESGNPTANRFDGIMTIVSLLRTVEFQLMRKDNTVIPGLLMAGVDAGGFIKLGYAGGLGLALVTGLWAAREVTRELGLPEPRLPAADARDAAPIHGRL
ncbi:hypothetical protein N7448_009024 [Penicillium atrosanguineum]|uniref:FAD-dependent oxidoreductase 2 FAD-binding domain-containing protein n=1 Tax=Penicillium atrosanguineum TaxID=1132637 RepID=A0A9W9Q2G2_9EURO|nr:CAZyme family CE10 [Penicillium atrosanguineum]KAJ5122927.1 hypothetical protein N7448_009024 [Penicillium atrosanguineum]KAJ5137225.1 hypothetical protein N7526_003458 [Penicillium atrosanguineum]KAJ5298150.1 CAZyme family CE10 [Penicillium atrosanguineum]KAJ5321584.1 hypothetical protein N7476_004586 [Penicillium atrosanguineum]